jgi:hypothetical protein
MPIPASDKSLQCPSSFRYSFPRRQLTVTRKSTTYLGCRLRRRSIDVADFAGLELEAGMWIGRSGTFEAFTFILSRAGNATEHPRQVISLYSIGWPREWKVSKVIAPMPPDCIQDHTWGTEVFASQRALSESITSCYDNEEKDRPKRFFVKALQRRRLSL